VSRLLPDQGANSGGYRTFFRKRKGSPWHLERMENNKSECGITEFDLNDEGQRVYGLKFFGNWMRRKSVCARCRVQWKRRQ
jgi:hypothetical protein